MLNKIISILKGFKMSLHDVDKTNSNRITSALNSADEVQQRMAQGTNQVQNSIEGEDERGLRTLERQILAVQDGTNKAVMGFYGTDNKFGFKVAEDGVDVLTATDDQLIFNSEQNVFKIITSGTTTLTPTNTGSPNYTVTSGGYSVEVDLSQYELASPPAVIAYFKFFTTLTSGSIQIYDTKYQLMPYTAALNDTNINGNLFYKLENDTITFVYNQYTASVNWGTTPSIIFKYYILQETAN